MTCFWAYTRKARLVLAQPFRHPIGGGCRPIVCGFMQNEHERATHLGTAGNERHHGPAGMVGWYDDAVARPDLRFAVRGLYAKPASRCVPRLGSRMAMFRRHIARIRDALHVLGRILFTRLHRQWAYFGHTHATRRHPDSPMVNSQTRSKASTTVPRGPFAASAAARVG